MTRLHGEVSRSINVWRSQHGGHQPSRILLSGGGSTMLYITDFFNEKLRLPVEYLNTFGAITIDDSSTRRRCSDRPDVPGDDRHESPQRDAVPD